VAKVAEPEQQSVAEAQGAAQTVEVGGNPPYFEAVELDRLRAELAMYTKAHGAVVQQAKGDTGIAAPQTIDGYRVLLEAVEAILKERK
jgi:hypothetical protein